MTVSDTFMLYSEDAFTLDESGHGWITNIKMSFIFYYLHYVHILYRINGKDWWLIGTHMSLNEGKLQSSKTSDNNPSNLCQEKACTCVTIQSHYISSITSTVPTLSHLWTNSTSILHPTFAYSNLTV